jgi:hypothetical protein
LHLVNKNVDKFHNLPQSDFELNEIPKNVSDSVRKRNPHLYPPLGGMAAGQPQQSQVSPLEQLIQKRQKGKGGVAVVVTLIACRRRELDDDGNVASQKPLRDAIANSLGIDDADARIRFEYGQCETRSLRGVIVKIEK